MQTFSAVDSRESASGNQHCIQGIESSIARGICI